MLTNDPIKRLLSKLLCGATVLFASAGILFAQDNKDGISINKRPTNDFAVYVREQIESKALDLSAPFDVELEGKLSKNGRLDTATAKFTKTEGDKASVEMIKRGIEAINDAGWFQYLSQLSLDKIVIRARQDDSNTEFSISGFVESESKAKTFASGLTMMLQLAGTQKGSEDDLLLIKNTAVSASGKQLAVKLSLPTSVVRGIVDRHLSPAKTARRS